MGHFKNSKWNNQQINFALLRGPHRSCKDYLEFLQNEFVCMIQKRQWVILPYKEVQHFENLRLSPPGVIPQREKTKMDL